MLILAMLLACISCHAETLPDRVRHSSATAEGIETVVISQAADATLQPMKLFIGILGKGRDTEQGQSFLADLQRCCAWSGRFAVTLERLDRVPKKKKEVQKLFQDLYDCALFITYDGPSKPVEWRLYDTAMGTMLEGKRFGNTEGGAPSGCALADIVLHALTSEPQPFSSKIVYRKKDRRGISHLMVTDFDGTHTQTMLESKRIIVAPRWNNDPEYPMVLYSEFTPHNVRLMMGDLHGHSMVVLDVEGTTVGVSYAQVSDDVVYCRSGDIWYYHYDKKTKKGTHTRIVAEDDTCASPVLMPNGDVLYCCRGGIKIYDAATKSRRVLIGDGYCVAPSYSPVSNKVAYAKRVNKQMEIFLYDMKTHQHEQVTFGRGNKNSPDYQAQKTDPCWAPDGVHLAFCWERGGTSRIGVLNTLTKQYRCITPEKDFCSYPAWSGNLAFAA